MRISRFPGSGMKQRACGLLLPTKQGREREEHTPQKTYLRPICLITVATTSTLWDHKSPNTMPAAPGHSQTDWLRLDWIGTCPILRNDPMTQRQATLTTGPVGRTLLRMTAPMVFGHFSTVAFHLADTVFVAQLGTKELAAISFTFPVVQLVAGIAIGLGIGTGAVVSQAIGNRDQHLVRRLATHSLILSVMIVAVLSGIGLLTIGPLFRSLGATGNILPMIKDYMGIWYIAAIFSVVPMVGNNSIRATGDTLFPSLIMMISAGLNLVLDPLLIFGWFGFPRMELQGAALATLIARVLGLLAALAILHFRDRLLDFTLPRLAALWDSWKRVLSIGAPTVGAMILLPVSMGIITKIASEFGYEAVAALGAGTRIGTLAMLLVRSLSTVLVVFIGQNWGARRFDRIHTAQRHSFWFSFGWGVFCVVVLSLCAKPLGRLFSDQAEVVGYIALYLYVIPIGYGLRGICQLTGAVLNAVNRPLRSLAINVVRMCVLYVPLAFCGSIVFRHLGGLDWYGYLGLLSGMTAANIFGGILSILVLRASLATLEGPFEPAVVALYEEVE